MKRFRIIALILLIALLPACNATGPAAQPGSASETPTLKVTGGEINVAYTRAELEALPASEAVFKEIAYRGVSVTALIEAAGFDPAQVKAIKALASDGFTANYEPAQILTGEVIVAYARADGALAEEDGAFRIVAPGAEGKLNVRMLVEIQVIR